jgi:hypothetical protein
MRLLRILPHVEPNEIEVPEVCPYEDRAGESLHHHQTAQKALRDTQYPAVEVERYQCLRCGRTFRVYPIGMNRGGDIAAAEGTGGDDVPVGLELRCDVAGAGAAGGSHTPKL